MERCSQAVLYARVQPHSRICPGHDVLLSHQGVYLAQSVRPGDGVFVVGPLFGRAAGAEGAFLVEDGGQVTEVLAGVVSGGLVPVVARSGERFEVEVEVASG
jgi:hypothetical protein